MERSLRVLRNFTSQWGGEELDEHGLVRFRNVSGTRPPLVWCFNAQTEFPLLADALGSDQPIIGMRSLNMIEPTDVKRYAPDKQLADFYTRVLLLIPHIDLGMSTIGGNCQGAGIAIRIADNLVSTHRPVHTLITMEAQSWLPFPGRVGHIFGNGSEEFNPFLKGETPFPLWNSLFSESLVEITTGGHGEYFTEQNLPALCTAIRRIVDRPRTDASSGRLASRLRLEFLQVPDRLRLGSQGKVRLRAMGGDAPPAQPINDAYLYAVWQSVEHGLRCKKGSGPVKVCTSENGVISEITLDAPKRTGPWELQLFVCSKAHGPLAWQRETDRSFDVEVV